MQEMENSMYAVILAGGSGTRLWPLSRTLFPKQCLNLTGGDRTLFQATVERVLGVVAEQQVFVVRSRSTVGQSFPELTSARFFGGINFGLCR